MTRPMQEGHSDPPLSLRKQEMNLSCGRCTPSLWRQKDTITGRDRIRRVRSLYKQTCHFFKALTQQILCLVKLFILYWDMCMCSVTSLCPTLCNPWAVAHQSHLSMGFSRQEYWSGLPFPPPGDFPDQGIKPHLHPLHCQTDSLPLSHLRSPKDVVHVYSEILVSH